MKGQSNTWVGTCELRHSEVPCVKCGGSIPRGESPYSLFKAEVYEIAFGDDAINRNFSDQEVIEKLRSFCSLSHKAEESGIKLPTGDEEPLL
jgi:hypothetical protein